LIKDRVLIVDGLNVFMRHYVAHPAMSDNGEQIGGIVGFYYNLMHLITKCKPESAYVIWEGGGSKRKRDLYPDYKKKKRPAKLNRYYDNDEIPDTMRNRNYQIKTLIDLLNSLPICQIYIEDAEADDAIGYMVKYKLKSKNKIIASADHDYYQLIGPDCILYSPTLKAFVDTKKVIERYNVHPENFALAKSIVGDAADNIPGVPKVGFKTLTKEYKEFLDPSFNNNYFQLFIDNAVRSDSSKKKIYHNIKKNEKLIERNYKLVNLDVNNLVHYQTKRIDESIENFKPTWNNLITHKTLKENNIKSIDILQHGHLFRSLMQGNT
jgi:5'-3' exonuclease